MRKWWLFIYSLTHWLIVWMLFCREQQIRHIQYDIKNSIPDHANRWIKWDIFISLSHRLSLLELQDSCVFEGLPGCLFLTYDLAALEDRKYYEAGVLIGWSLAQGGPGPRCLHPALYQVVCMRVSCTYIMVCWRSLLQPECSSYWFYMRIIYNTSLQACTEISNAGLNFSSNMMTAACWCLFSCVCWKINSLEKNILHIKPSSLIELYLHICRPQ